MFERETKREKILEAQNKEKRLKNKTGGMLSLIKGRDRSSTKDENTEKEDPIVKAEREFFETINKVSLFRILKIYQSYLSGKRKAP